jgi:RNA polymerase sigma-70 factor (ECF subfamily)
MERRDPAAIDALYLEFSDTVLAYLLRTLGDRGSAEDVRQQVFAELWERAAEYDPDRAGLLTWVLMITRSRAIDQLRRGSRQPDPQPPARVAVLADARAERVPADDRMIERWRIAHLLRRIPTEEADLLRKRFYEERSQREIAEETGIPLGTVKMRMVQALERLRVMIEEEER